MVSVRYFRIVFSPPPVFLPPPPFQGIEPLYRYNLLMALPAGPSSVTDELLVLYSVSGKIYSSEGKEVVAKVTGNLKGSEFKVFNLPSGKEAAFIKYSANWFGNHPRQLTALLAQPPPPPPPDQERRGSDSSDSSSSSGSDGEGSAGGGTPLFTRLKRAFASSPFTPPPNAVAASPSSPPTPSSPDSTSAVGYPTLPAPSSLLSPAGYSLLVPRREKSLQRKYKKRPGSVLALKNRQPWWSANLNAFVLNFHGRVTEVSRDQG